MLILIGSSHRSAPIALREQLAFPPEEIPRALARLRERHEVAEAMIVSTCNRVELLVRSDRVRGAGVEELKGFFGGERSVPREELERHAYVYEGDDAVRHLFRVASGLDSMILGEPQILGQVKQAYAAAKGCGATGPVLDRLLQQCFATAKRVRTVTGISRNAVSVAYAAVNLARQIFGDLHGRRALLLGSGKMSALVARHLVPQGVESICVASRTYNNAVMLADRVDGEALSWEDGLQRLGQVDIVVSCTGAPRTILGREQVAGALRSRRGRPLFIIDIAVPRDVDPEVNRLDNVYVYDIDALQAVVDANLESRRSAARLAVDEIECDVEAFARWRQSLEVTPTIVGLREKMLGLGLSEMERHRAKLGPLTADQERAVHGILQGLVHKILHRPIVYLKESVDRGDVDRVASAYREIFGLDGPDGSGRGGPAGRRNGAPSEAPPGAGPQRLLKGGRRD
jgi:glutamyl-tRNA reductase